MHPDDTCWNRNFVDMKQTSSNFYFQFQPVNLRLLAGQLLSLSLKLMDFIKEQVLLINNLQSFFRSYEYTKGFRLSVSIRQNGAIVVVQIQSTALRAQPFRQQGHLFC
jgi:hypothetical protein